MIEASTALVATVVGDPEQYNLDGVERPSAILALRDDPSGSTVRLVYPIPGAIPSFVTAGAPLSKTSTCPSWALSRPGSPSVRMSAGSRLPTSG